MYYIGTLIGALIAGSLADRCGRIKAVVFGAMWALLGAVLQASALNIAWMCFGRVIAGVGVGAIDCVIPVWSAEVSSHSARGAFLAIEFFMVGTAPTYPRCLAKFSSSRILEVLPWLTGSNSSPTLMLTRSWRGEHLWPFKLSSSSSLASELISFQSLPVGL